MTDDQMHARLRDAGERWRGAHTATAESDGEELVFAPAKQSHHRRWLAMASAAVVTAALVTAGVTLINRSHRPATGAVENVGIGRLEGVRWIDKVSGAWATFTAHTVRISDGCEGGSYALRVVGNRWTIGRQIGPLAVCPGPPPPPTGFYHQQYEQRANAVNTFFKAMTGAAQWSVSGQSLVVRTVTGRSVELMTTHGLAMSVYDNPWQLAHVVRGQNELPGDLSAGSLTFDRDGSVRGNDICNELSGSVDITDTNIVFKSLAMTERACTDPLQANASSVVDTVLSGSVSIDVGLNELTLSDLNGDELVYVPASPDQPGDPSQLAGRSWVLTGTSATTNSYSPATTATAVEFDGTGGFTVQHRCYTDRGNVDLAAGTAVLSNVTLKSSIPCTSPIDGETSENQFVDGLLTGSVTWSIDIGELTISKSNGTSATFDDGSVDLAPSLLRWTWRLTSIEQGSGPYGSSSTPTASITLSIASGTLTIAGDCGYPASGRIKLRGHDQMDIGHIATSTASCAAGYKLAAPQRTAVRDVLRGRVTWSVVLHQLTITKTGVGALVFTKA